MDRVVRGPEERQRIAISELPEQAPAPGSIHTTCGMQDSRVRLQRERGAVVTEPESHHCIRRKCWEYGRGSGCGPLGNDHRVVDGNAAGCRIENGGLDKGRLIRIAFITSASRGIGGEQLIWCSQSCGGEGRVRDDDGAIQVRSLGKEHWSCRQQCHQATQQGDNMEHTATSHKYTSFYGCRHSSGLWSCSMVSRRDCCIV